MIVPIADGEAILRRENREIGILVASEEVTITHARYAAGDQTAGPHVHDEHTDAFYVLEGELTFEIGREAKMIKVSSGGFIAAPPLVAHSFRNDSDRPARWLTIHAHDEGFAAFMRGVRDGVEVEWDISKVPADGGLPASAAIVTPGFGSRSRGVRESRVLGQVRATQHLPGRMASQWTASRSAIPRSRHPGRLVLRDRGRAGGDARGDEAERRPRHADLGPAPRAAHPPLSWARARADAEPPHARRRLCRLPPPRIWDASQPSGLNSPINAKQVSPWSTGRVHLPL